ncbi:MAG: cytochrome P450 [Propionibacteriaceae bacterium]|nr:cytochrome P450 [Propionibacteriaceae bacterium]
MALPALVNDKTPDLLRLGYRFTDRLRADSDDPRAPSRVPLRLLGEDALLVRGAEGVRLFYDDTAIKRDGALPTLFSGGLFGKGSVHGLDDEAHLVRKQLFVRAAMDDDAVATLMADARDAWGRHIDNVWTAGWEGSVYDAAVEVYGRSILRWAGVRTDDVTATRLARDEALIVDGFAVVGPAFVLSKLKRRQCDAWFTHLIRRARAGTYPVRESSALDLVLQHTDADGQPLSDHLAAVELQNVIRPTIAVARFAAFAALALHTYPEWRGRISDEVVERGSTIDAPVAVAFAEEVRRYFPFVPLLPGVARRDLTHEGVHVAKGQRVLLDFYGTLHDQRHWDTPDRFDPHRFLGTGEVFAEYFIPQGGGEVETGHRCPGEKVAVGLLALTVAELARLDYELPPQDLSYEMTRMPTAPRDGVVLARVRRR